MKFEEMNLPSFIMEGLTRQEFGEATDIQSKCIPAIIEGRDVVGTSQTGSGKTYAFAIPALGMIDESVSGVQVLIICPTRELTAQVCEETRKLTSFGNGLKLAPIFGGSSIERQIIALKKGAKMVVGTPGRLMDHMRRKTLRLDKIKLVVLDEADEMLDMGFREDIESILKATNPNRQTVMFSATMPKEILDITKNYMVDPVLIEGDTQGKAQTFITQYFIGVDRANKNAAVAHILEIEKPMRSVIFCNTKSMVDELSSALVEHGITSVGLHGDMRQSERRKAMLAIKENRIAVLIATDVAARGIDIKDIDVVINFDIPNNREYYVHRIGRTARAGKSGKAYTIVNNRAQMQQLELLRKETKNEIPEYTCDLSVNLASKKSTNNRSADKKPNGKKPFFNKNKNGDNFKKKHDSKMDGDFKPDFAKKKDGDYKKKDGDFKPDFGKKRDFKKDGDYKKKEGDFKPDFKKKEGDFKKKDGDFKKKDGFKPDFAKKKDSFKKGKKVYTPKQK